MKNQLSKMIANKQVEIKNLQIALEDHKREYYCLLQLESFVSGFESQEPSKELAT